MFLTGHIKSATFPTKCTMMGVINRTRHLVNIFKCYYLINNHPVVYISMNILYVLAEDAALPRKQGPVQTSSHVGGLLHTSVLPRGQGEGGRTSHAVTRFCSNSVVMLHSIVFSVLDGGAKDFQGDAECRRRQSPPYLRWVRKSHISFRSIYAVIPQS